MFRFSVHAALHIRAVKDRKPNQAVVAASMQEDYCNELMSLLNGEDLQCEDVNAVRDKQRELKASRKQEVKDPWCIMCVCVRAGYCKHITHVHECDFIRIARNPG